jgi:hypothetical protein
LALADRPARSVLRAPPVMLVPSALKGQALVVPPVRLVLLAQLAHRALRGTRAFRARPWLVRPAGPAIPVPPGCKAGVDGPDSKAPQLAASPVMLGRPASKVHKARLDPSAPGAGSA